MKSRRHLSHTMLANGLTQWSALVCFFVASDASSSRLWHFFFNFRHSGQLDVLDVLDFPDVPRELPFCADLLPDCPIFARCHQHQCRS